MRPQSVMDIECFPNYFLVAFLRRDDDRSTSFEFRGNGNLDVAGIIEVLEKYEVVTFNGTTYDIPLLRYALQGANTAQLKRASDDLIVNELKPYQFEKKYQLPELELNHIDLIEVAPGKASLKIYGGRIHSEKMQDLPYDEKTLLTPEQMAEVKQYCGNDLKVTKELLIKLTPQIELRREMSNQYKCDLRSKSDAQIAETVIKAEIQRKTKGNLGKAQHISRFVYEAPSFIKFRSQQLNDALKLVTTQPFTVSHSGRIDMPKDLATLKIKMGSSVYQMGMGGLHSTEKSRNHVAGKNTLICDWDVASYYPAIILNCGLYPKQLGKEFLEVYKELVDTRLAGKRAGNKVIADSLRIVINGSFGKLGSVYSSLYAPELMVQVTVTGQLALLMLIEALEGYGVEIVSGNTDGIVMKLPKDKEQNMLDVIKGWEETTGFSMERTDYTGIYSRDVNNYIAVKPDGKVKTKGCFSPAGLQKNPQNEICNEAVIKYLTEGVELEDTLRACKDVTKFLTVRTVKGGSVKNGVYLGKAIRWLYKVNERGYISYKSNGNKVPRTEGGFPVMNLPEKFPDFIDYDWYLRECYDLLSDLGIGGRNGQMSLF